MRGVGDSIFGEFGVDYSDWALRAIADAQKQIESGLSFRPTLRAFKASVLHFFEQLDDYEYELKRLLTLKYQVLAFPALEFYLNKGRGSTSKTRKTPW